MVSPSNFDNAAPSLCSVAHVTNSRAASVSSNQGGAIVRGVKLLACAGLTLAGAGAAAADAGLQPVQRYRVGTQRLPESLRPGRATLDSIVHPTEPARAGGRSLAQITFAPPGLTPTPTPTPTPLVTAAPATPPPPVLPGLPPPHLLSPQIASASLVGCPASGLSAAVTIGGQTLMAQVDTGSWAFGVVSSDCDGCLVTPKYTPGATSHDWHQQVVTNYVKGNWSGGLMSDQVSFAAGATVDLKFAAINATYNFFEPYICNRSANAQPAGILNQGLMGLAPNPGAPESGMGSYISQAFRAMDTSTYTFAPCDFGGMFYIGGYPAEVSANTPFYTPLATANQSVYVAAAMTSAALGGQDLGFTLDNLGYSLVDTGTTLWHLPPAQFQSLVSAVSVATNGVFDEAYFSAVACKTLQGKTVADVNAMAPNLTVWFARPDMTNMNTHYIGYPATDSYLDAQPDGLGNTVVCSMIGSNPEMTIFGSGMMRGLLVDYDYANNQVGFGISKNICS